MSDEVEKALACVESAKFWPAPKILAAEVRRLGEAEKKAIFYEKYKDDIAEELVKVGDRAEKAEAERDMFRSNLYITEKELGKVSDVANKAEAELKECRGELADIKQTYKWITEQPCDPGAVHCSCVPALRAKAESLKEKLRIAEEEKGEAIERIASQRKNYLQMVKEARVRAEELEFDYINAKSCSDAYKKERDGARARAEDWKTSWEEEHKLRTEDQERWRRAEERPCPSCNSPERE